VEHGLLQRVPVHLQRDPVDPRAGEALAVHRDGVHAGTDGLLEQRGDGPPLQVPRREAHGPGLIDLEADCGRREERVGRGVVEEVHPGAAPPQVAIRARAVRDAGVNGGVRDGVARRALDADGDGERVGVEARGAGAVAAREREGEGGEEGRAEDAKHGGRV
jgi:hypothetical protein